MRARDLLMNLEEHADGLKFLIRDPDASFPAAFDAVFTAVGVRIIKAPVQAPCGTQSRNAGWVATAVSAWIGC